MLYKHAEKYVFSEKKFRFVTALDLIKCLKLEVIEVNALHSILI